MSLKKLFQVFILGFIFNIIWENLHSSLYMHYQGGEITELILLRATLFDTAFIGLAFFIVYTISVLKNNKLLWLIIIGLVGAIIIELHALNTNRWAYGQAMPIIPFLNTGLTPTIQLAFITSLIYKITKNKRVNNWISGLY